MTNAYPNPLTPGFVEGIVKKKPANFYDQQGLMVRGMMAEKVVPVRTVTGFFTYEDAPLAGLYPEQANPEPFPGDIPGEQWTAHLMHLAAKAIVNPQNVVDIMGLGETTTFTSRSDHRLYDRVTEAIAEQTIKMDKAIERTVEYLGISALQGEVTWPPPGCTVQPQWGRVNKTFTVPGFESNLHFTATGMATHTGETLCADAAWTDRTNSKPHIDMEAMDRYLIENYGISLEGYTFIGSRNVMRNLWMNANIKSDFGSDWPAHFFNVEQRGQFIEDNWGFKFKPYDAMFSYDDLGNIETTSAYSTRLTRTRYLTEGRLIGIPSGSPVGYLATADTIIQNGKLATGKYTGLKKDDEHPFTTRLWVGEVIWPIVTRPHEIVIFDTHL